MSAPALLAPAFLVPVQVSAAGPAAERRFLEFFGARIRNPNTRRAYKRATHDFLAFMAGRGIGDLRAIEPLHVAAWVEWLGGQVAPPTVKQRLAAVRHLFDWLVVAQVVLLNPAASVRGPSHSVRTGKTPVLEPAQARQLLGSIDVSTIVGLRDRALIGLMTYSFARVGAATALRVEDVYEQRRRLWVRLREKGGKRHEMPCHHTLEAYLQEYMDSAGIVGDRKGWVFRTIDRGTRHLSDRALPQANVWAMLQRRTLAAGIGTRVGCHTFRATGITAYLKNGGTLERAAVMANHTSTRTTQLYDRRADEVCLDEVERVLI